MNAQHIVRLYLDGGEGEHVTLAPDDEFGDGFVRLALRGADGTLVHDIGMTSKDAEAFFAAGLEALRLAAGRPGLEERVALLERQFASQASEERRPWKPGTRVVDVQLHEDAPALSRGSVTKDDGGLTLEVLWDGTRHPTRAVASKVRRAEISDLDLGPR